MTKESIVEIFKAIIECFFVGFILRFSLVFVLEARLEDFWVNVIGYYMLSGALGIYAIWQAQRSEIYKLLKERSNEQD